MPSTSDLGLTQPPVLQAAHEGAALVGAIPRSLQSRPQRSQAQGYRHTSVVLCVWFEVGSPTSLCEKNLAGPCSLEWAGECWTFRRSWFLRLVSVDSIIARGIGNTGANS